MNLYGDLGNVITLQKRAEWRDIEVKVEKASIGDDIETLNTDLYFLGGGQDKDQMEVYKDLTASKKAKLAADLEKEVPMLAICGGYQLLGDFFLDAKGNKIPGIGFLPIDTVAPGPELKQRAIGNLVTKLPPESPLCKHPSKLKTLVGFENHGGRTRLKKKSSAKPLGEVLIGEGDNEDGTSDGVIYKNTIATYMHGSVLPKNPHLADFLLEKALEHKYGKKISLKPLDDDDEVSAHNYVLGKYKVNGI